MAPKSLTLSQISEAIEGELDGDPNLAMTGAAPFETAAPDQVTYAGTPAYLKRIEETAAGAVIVPRRFAHPSKNLIHADYPQAAFARLLNLFLPERKCVPGIDPSAVIGRRFSCGSDPHIAPCVVVADRVTLGDRVVLHPGVFLGSGVVLGNDVEIFPNVTILEECRIGDRVKIHAGTVIGSDGFGYAPEGRAYRKVPHTGTVRIDADVEIGALNTIDRATFGTTWIQRGVKTDNMVHIAHNVTVGEDSIIVAQVAIAGSVTIGRHAVIAGQAAVSGHVTLGDDVTIGARAGVLKSLPDRAVVSGGPDMPHNLWLRVQQVIPKLPELKKKILDLEKRLNRIESGGNG
jgi:UDP-3-O-[3-hydroxymyristoyl] glucosamine N-acyltransferase